MKEFNINAEDRLKIEVIFSLFKFYWTVQYKRCCRHNILYLLRKIDIGEEFEEHDEHIFEYCMLFYNKLFSSSSDLSESDKSAVLKELIDINNKFPEHTMCIEEINEIVTYKRYKFDTVPNDAHIYEDEEGKLYCLVDRNRVLFGTKMYIFNKDKNKWEEDTVTPIYDINLVAFMEKYGEKRFKPTDYDYPFYHDSITINEKNIISGGDLHTYENWQNRRLHR